MAESVITSVASSVISSTINSLATLARDEINFLGDVPAKVQLIEAKLRVIQSYLKDAENKPQKSHLTANWLHELKSVAYRAQDVIEKILWLQRRRDRARGCAGAFSRYANIPGYLKSLHEIGAEIDRINSFIPGIVDITNNLSAVNLGENSSMADQSEDERFQDPRTFSEEDEVIGFETEIAEIIKELLDPMYKPLSVVSLLGMGGIGKTTLARKVFNHSDVQRHFDLIAMITVSKEYNVLNIHKEILKATNQFIIEDLNKMAEGEVRHNLYNALEQKKYLIVMDDIWETRSWDEINYGKKIFPDKSNGSRVLLTTRNLEVATHPNFRKLIHEVKSLDDEKSLELLKKKAFPPYEMVSDSIRNELEGQCSLLIKKCKGLPLALIVLGGYLSKHLDFQTWSRMAKAVDWNEVGNQIDISKILALSYHDLPSYLKPVFLYTTVFPEDHIIECSDLIKLWIGEGFVQPSQKYKLEIMAQIYVDQLYERGLVQVVERSRIYGWISKIRIHDVLHDWGRERAKEVGDFHFIKNFDHANSCSPHISYRAAFYNYCEGDSAALMPNARTILGFELLKNNLMLRGLNSMRVLFLEHNNNMDDHINISLIYSSKHIKHMIFLRYIHLRSCGKVYFPSSIGELSNLQTLECVLSRIMSLPSSLWEISTLRHIYLQRICCNWNGPKKGSGRNLQTLAIYENSKDKKYIGLLEKNMAWMYTGMNGVSLAVEEMEQIVKLELCVWGYSLPRNLLSKFSGLHNLEELELLQPIKGLTRIPANAFPPSILKLGLVCRELVEDPMPVLQELPKVIELYLERAYQLKTMRCSSNGFPRLKYLTLYRFPVLEDWKVDCGAMPCLHELRLVDCYDLKKFPDELMERDQLKLLELIDSSHLFKADYSKLQEKGCKVTKMDY